MNDTIKTLLEQMHWPEMSRMIGAKNATFDNANNALQFRFPMCKIANVCRVRYCEDSDLYNMKFYSIRGKHQALAGSYVKWHAGIDEDGMPCGGWWFDYSPTDKRSVKVWAFRRAKDGAKGEGND